MGLLASMVSRVRPGNTINVNLYQYHNGTWVWAANITAQPAVIITIVDVLFGSYKAAYSNGAVFYQK